jgi:very-short-patch-repair endonuclease
VTNSKQPTALGTLCHYYLSCLEAADTDRIAAFGKGTRKQDYVELPHFAVQRESALDQTTVASVIQTLRQDNNRLVAYVGYLCHVHVSQAGRKIEPFFVLPVHVGDGPAPTIMVDPGLPAINPGAVRSLIGTAGSPIEEVIQLEDDLALNRTSADGLTLTDLNARLRELMPDWPWREELTPEGAPVALADVSSSGLYSRAVFFVAERSAYTVGLERELQQLAGLSEADLEGTALGTWMTLATEPPRRLEGPAPTLIEALPLNSEQRTAVEAALTQPLTVITGPPGTGKSQVVAEILINAAWHGQRALFASKNNKAVDVVESRVNHLGVHPILLRLGSGPHEFVLASFLLKLLENNVTEADQAAFEAASRVHQRLDSRLSELGAQEQALIGARNTVDELDRGCEDLRKALPRRYQQLLKTVSLEPVASALASLAEAILDARREDQQVLVRMLWALIYRGARFHEVEDCCAALNGALKSFGRFSVPALSDGTLPAWQDQVNRMTHWLSRSQQFKGYLDALKHLQGKVSLDTLALQRTDILASMRDNALQLWERWVQLRPATLTATDRELLETSHAALQLALDIKPGQVLDANSQRQFRDLLDRISHVLPCWAATSLSVRGRVPFKAAEFDVVVFDESSQCDIASALPLLYRAKRAVVIGDPRQLSHISGFSGSFDQMLLQRFGLAEQYPQFAYHYNSLFDLAANLVRSDNVLKLRDHHRSHADIIGFSNREFYGSELRIATDYAKLNLPGTGAGVRWLDVPGKASRHRSGATNRKEAERLVQALRDLLESGYRGSVGVVSPFRAQANLIRELVAADSRLTANLADSECLIETVHKFQGDERDVVFFSPVLSLEMPSSAETYLRKNGNLFNVAITRARAQLVVVGDRQCALGCSVPYLANFVRYVDELGARRSTTRGQAPLISQTETEALDPAWTDEWEPLVYRALMHAGFAPVAHVQEEKYNLDLALVQGRRRLDIEVDSEYYHQPWDSERCRRDQIRTQRLQELGWDVLRFWVYEVRDDLEGCVARIKAWAEREPPFAP